MSVLHVLDAVPLWIRSVCLSVGSTGLLDDLLIKLVYDLKLPWRYPIKFSWVIRHVGTELVSSVSETFSLSVMRGRCDGCCGHTYLRLCSRMSQWYTLRQPRCGSETLDSNAILTELIAWEGLIAYWNSSSRKTGKYSFPLMLGERSWGGTRVKKTFEVHCHYIPNLISCHISPWHTCSIMFITKFFWYICHISYFFEHVCTWKETKHHIRGFVFII